MTLNLLHFSLFGDDTNNFASNEKLVLLMSKELEHVNDWFIANKLSLNATKTSYILFSSHRKRSPKEAGIVSINNVPIPKVSLTKFLEVYIASITP